MDVLFHGFINTIVAADCSGSVVNGSCLPHIDVTAGGSTFSTVTGIVFGIVGALALLMVVISGFRYVLSSGDPQKTARARESIIYALVGLALALAAESIVYFVGNQL